MFTCFHGETINSYGPNGWKALEGVNCLDTADHIDRTEREVEDADSVAYGDWLDGTTETLHDEALIVADPWGRKVIRESGCQHPGISDAQVLAYHDESNPYLKGDLHCKVAKSHTGLTGETYHYQCGYWYTRENDDGDIEVIDEPPGSGY